MSRHGGARTAVLAGSVALAGLFGVGLAQIMTRPETLLGWSFGRSMERSSFAWAPVAAGPVALDTVERPGYGAALSTAAVTGAAPVSPQVTPMPYRRFSLGDVITLGRDDGKISHLEVVDVRTIDPSLLGIAAKPGLPGLSMVVFRDVDEPGKPVLRLLMDAAPNADAVPTRS